MCPTLHLPCPQVMDDNKMLTLASNERVPLNGTMRLCIEVADLRNASPATVSRGGVLMLNERDIGWRPFVESWVQNRASKAGKKNPNLDPNPNPNPNFLSDQMLKNPNPNCLSD